MAERTPSQERWQRFLNTVFYDSYPEAYNLIDHLTFGIWWRLIRRALDYVPHGGKVLEVGFGPGRLHVELVRRSELCVGLDLAWGMCHFTHRRLLKSGLAARLVQGSVFNVPYPACTFDAVVSTFAFSGFPDGKRAMDEIVRVTKTNGSVILVDIGLPTDQNRIGVWLARLWEKIGDSLTDQPKLMDKAGLNVTVFEEYGPGKHIRLIVGKKL